MSDLIIPFFIALIMIIGLIKHVDVFGEFTEGAKENLKAAFDVLPALIALMTAIGMFKASGTLEIISEAISPITEFLGFPEECIPLAIIRPVSGSGALAVFESILNDVSPDSFAGRVASVIIGSTETTFYTIAVYYGITNVKKTRHAVTSSLTADLTGFIISALTVRLILGNY
ncbi:MAG: spore maturation protein [Oscillospiraceae bacterium]|nr:spore maturation protein [Oscillospiraceae bacterium]